MSAGLILAVTFLLFDLKKNKEKIGPYIDLIYFMLFSGVLGGRVFYVALHFGEFENNWLSIFRFWDGGMSFFGGFMLAFPLYLLFLWRYKLSLWQTSDRITPPFILALIFFKLGCLGAGCCFGSQCNALWAVHYNSEILPNHLQGAMLHPTQLYEAIALFLLFLLSWYFTSMKKMRAGYVAILFIGSYGFIRFIEDFFRGDNKYFSLVPNFFTATQYLAVILIFSSIILFRIRRRYPA